MASRLERFRYMLEAAHGRRGVALMGVCNVTPDSFSDGGRYLGADAARARVDELMAEGADIIDVGGESTRPGAAPVPPSEQLGRVLEVVRYAAERTAGWGRCVTIDTTSPAVAAACLDAGACAVNDVSCLRDVELAKVVAANGASLILMHSRATQQEMRGFSDYPDDAYGDVVADVGKEWVAAAGIAAAYGVPWSGMLMDPGLGFAKNARQSMELLRRLEELRDIVRVPIVVGASRKSFLTDVDEKAPATERIGASLAAARWAADCGAGVLRVHDVRATAQMVDLCRLLEKAP